MPRAPNEQIKKAKELFDQGKKMVDIAATLGIPEGTIRSWKKRYKWDATL
ncbi:transposase [Acetobacterium paludosum]|uniref:Transposase n=1 Tax=Acetobacterium paludosum TaxID=52693 RepID=A0A923HZY7_9FIRM|nr:helix-turn-helix domain-containing protein [Acetobacterium paludosum]MBC3887608.1 transposase [Acetobacterium paludosum]